ncbi:MAG TPA: ribose 5-phosphate isomerase A [Solirubrobacteraceae bacterium]
MRRDDASAWSASPLLPWPREVEHLEVKLDVARRIAERAADGEVIGLGSGSATFLTLWAIGRRVAQEELRVQVVTSSYETEVAATGLRLPLGRLGQVRPSWSVDGADEIDPGGRLLKGRGGALFREKLLWNTSARMVLAVDPTKHVERLGLRFPIPIEVHPNAVELVAARLSEHGARSAALRTGTGKDGPVLTEAGFLLLDAHFDAIPIGLDREIKAIPGVLETGLFEGYEYEIVE